MKLGLFILFLLSFSLTGYSQAIYEKGYFINNQQEKIDCFIKNEGRLNNPTTFEYKLQEDSNSRRNSIDSVVEFGNFTTYKFIRKTVNIDRSAGSFGKLSNTKKTNLVEETLFLKVIVEGGGASLYEYVDNGGFRAFIQVGNQAITQLIYKKYKTKEGLIAANSTFRQQVWNNLRCRDQDIAFFDKMKYSRSSFIKQVIRYNTCKDDEYTIYKAPEKKLNELFNITLRPGINTSSLEYRDAIEPIRNADFSVETTIRIGLEVELVLPFLRNRLSIFAEPTYQSYQSETTNTLQSLNSTYRSIEIPLGMRYNFFLNENNRIFINTGILIDFNINSFIEFEGEMTTQEFEPSLNLFFGVGYSYKRFSIETRVGTNRDLLPTFLNFGADFRSTTLILGYRLF